MRYFVVFSQLDEEDNRMDEKFRIRCKTLADANAMEFSMQNLLDTFATNDWYITIRKEEN